MRTLPLPTGLALGGFPLIIRANDASDQGMAHDVTLLEPDDADALDAFDGGGTLGLHFNVGHAGMAEAGSDSAADTVSETLGGADVVEEPG